LAGVPRKLLLRAAKLIAPPPVGVNARPGAPVLTGLVYLGGRAINISLPASA